MHTLKTEVIIRDVPFGTAYFNELPLVGELVLIGETWYTVKNRHHVMERGGKDGSGRSWFSQSAVLNLV